MLTNKVAIYKALPAIIAAILAIHLFNLPFAKFLTLTDKGPSWYGLDVSWQTTLNYHLHKGSTWGTDVIFTHGPLGFLVTRFGWGISKWVFLAFDLFLIANYFLIFRNFITKAQEKIIAVIILLCICLLIKPPDIPWVLLFFTFYWMYKTIESPRLSYFAVIAVLVSLSFYSKMNTGLVTGVFFIAHILNLLYFKKITRAKGGIAFLITIGLVIALAFIFHVSLIDYIKGSIESIKGYNDIMYLEEDHYNIEMKIRLLFCAMVVFLVFFAVMLIRRKDYAGLLFVAVSFIYLFLLKKQSMVRNDMSHLYQFFDCAPLLFLYGSFFSPPGRRQKLFSYTSFAIVIASLLFTIDKRPLDIAFKSRFCHKKDYIRQFNEFDALPYLKQKDKRYIPPALLEKIGNRSIDIFPWDCMYLLENHLNFTPRPVFQSYCTYTQWLQNRNYNFYVNKAPEFVLYDYDAIDQRYPFSDEQSVNLFLVKNYTIADTFTSNERWRLLLQKKNATSPVVWDKVKEEKMAFQSEIPVNGAICIKINANYNFRGKQRSFRYKSPRMDIAFMKPDGQWVTYKTSPEFLQAGILVDRLIQSNHDFADYISNKRDSLPVISRIKLIGDPRYFSSAIKVEYFNIR